MCGVTGLWFPKEAKDYGVHVPSILIQMGASLQSRGHDGAGGAFAEHGIKNCVKIHKRPGLVKEVFTEEILTSLQADCGIFHNRYATTGSAGSTRNYHPLDVVMGDDDEIENWCVVCNGNFTSELLGVRPGTSDTWEVFRNFEYVDSSLEIQERIFQALKDIDGAFSLIFLFKDKNGEDHLICVRDKKGFRPLWLGKYVYLDNHENEQVGYLVASETCAFDKVDAEILRPVDPGEIVVINSNGLISYKPEEWQGSQSANCIFEYIYFSHPTSLVETNDWQINPIYVYEIQKELGIQFAKENHDLSSDFISPVLDSAKFHSEGFSKESGVPIEYAVLRNHTSGRTFILPGEKSKSIKDKFSFLKKQFIRLFLNDDPTVIIGDDSLVRSNTFKGIILEIRKIVKKIEKKTDKHLKIITILFSPEIKFPCFMGIATSTKNELAINNFSGIDGVKKAIKVDELRYLSIDGLFKVAEDCTGHKNYCSACFTGNYPVAIKRKKYLKEIN